MQNTSWVPKGHQTIVAIWMRIHIYMLMLNINLIIVINDHHPHAQEPISKLEEITAVLSVSGWLCGKIIAVPNPPPAFDGRRYRRKYRYHRRYTGRRYRRHHRQRYRRRYRQWYRQQYHRRCCLRSRALLKVRFCPPEGGTLILFQGGWVGRYISSSCWRALSSSSALSASNGCIGAPVSNVAQEAKCSQRAPPTCAGAVRNLRHTKKCAPMPAWASTFFAMTQNFAL